MIHHDPLDALSHRCLNAHAWSFYWIHGQLGLKFKTPGGIRGTSIQVSTRSDTKTSAGLCLFTRQSSLCLSTGRRKSSKVSVSDRFDAIPIPQLSQHCTGWQSSAHVCSVLYFRVSPLVGAGSPLKPAYDRIFRSFLVTAKCNT